MHNKQFTIIEMIIALMISSAVFIILMGMVMNVAWLVRDNYIAQSLTNHSRYIRYIVLNGNATSGGLSSAIGDIEPTGGKLSYSTSKSEDYDLAEAISTPGYTPTTNEVEILTADSTISFDGENQLPASTKLLQGNKLTVDASGKDVYIRSYLSRSIMGRTYEMGILIRTYNQQ
ncbi:MAG: hypothetical protein KAG98_00085 [Lentisphaeria bacterium]|nr:hypothetical protein [Lentisphaeria bacterium]